MSCFYLSYHCRAICILASGIVVVWAGSLAFSADTVIPSVRAIQDTASGQIDVIEAGRPVLRYNYQTVKPPEGIADRLQPDNRKYTQPRSDYIHPLFGLDGETLTADWPEEHPHHRGIYWAWPEVDYRGNRGDLHALQNVFARPTGHIELRNLDNRAEIEAENVWKWEDKITIVHETSVIRVWRSSDDGRFIDLTLRFEAIEDDVTIARRGQTLYGGLNIRLAPVTKLEISPHTDPDSASPRRAWAEAGGIWRGAGASAALAVFQNIRNPEYPGQWIEYPELPWFQPTFPTAMTRYELKKGKPLELQYRLWIRRGGKPSDESYERHWQNYQQANSDPTLHSKDSLSSSTHN
jgi:hypothetical protein